MTNDEARLWLRLIWTDGMSFPLAKDLLGAFGLPERIFCAKQTRLAEIVPHPVARKLYYPEGTALRKRLDTALAWLEKTPEASLVTLADADYPRGFLGMPEPPVAFFVPGCRGMITRPAFSFIGTENPTEEALSVMTAWIRRLSRRDVILSEDDSRGVPLLAASSARAQKMPCALFPSEPLALSPNPSPLSVSIASDPFSGGPEEAKRLFLGFTGAFVLLEDTIFSKNMRFLREAADLNKTALGVPGPVTSPLSRGPHKVIRDGGMLCESEADILKALGDF